ncbi:MAG: GIY-YIG nuclease family protein [Chitinophagaceae bacterium]|nr:MAG: GIY-YIG nuclease family protein [Chitinophagaceae bacterium]
MPHYVYIIESLLDGTFYKGETAQPNDRLRRHNAGLNASTASRKPWRFLYLAVFPDRSAALKEEKRLKRTHKTYLRWLIEQPANLLKDPDALSRLA